MSGIFEPRFEDLPDRIPIFPLTGVLLLPRGRLPLNIFEPRYLAMIRAALATPHRLVGMVQPTEGEGDAGEPAVYRTGCAGRIVSFEETGDGRYLVELRGVARFDIALELPLDQPFRRIVPEWPRYKADLEETPSFVDHERMLGALRPYFAQQNINPDWHAIEATLDDRLVITVAMLCPFAPREKQALLEAEDTGKRAELLIGLMEMAVLAGSGTNNPQRH